MIHPLAAVSADASVDPSSEIGPWTLVEGGAEIGPSCAIASHAVIRRGSRLGGRIKVDSFVVAGGDPQDLSFDPAVESFTVIGAGTALREHVTVHRATQPGGATTIGSGCLLMAGSHVAHDCRVGDKVILANGSMLGGHVQVGDSAFISGGTAVHQLCRIGPGSMVSGNAVITEDVPPQVLAHGRNEVSGLNLVGLRCRGVPAESVAELKRAYHAVYGPGSDCARLADEALAAGEYRSPEAREFLLFFLGGRRGRFASPR
ncbi:MAG: acyl-ACP--UDP-N-acetylglucosamine O-acyltransferase [Verrucomicrobiota bacterium]